MVRSFIVAASAGVLMLGLAFAAAEGSKEARNSRTAGRLLTVAEVRREFRRHGLPLRELPSAGTFPRVFASPRGGPIFNVDVYGTEDAAVAAEDFIFVLRPVGYRTRGELMTRRNTNVVVVFETGRRRVRARLLAALEGLG